jgi:hypothetical protein
MRRELLVLALIAAGLVCIALLLHIAQGCSSEDTAFWLAVLLILGGSLFFAAASLLVAWTRSTRRWVPWAAALATMLVSTFALSVLGGLTAVSNCAR